MPQSINEILAAAADPGHRRTGVARVLLRQDLANRLTELSERVVAAVADSAEDIDPPAEVHALFAERLELEREIAGEVTEFRFRARTFREWADLLAANPPKGEQRERGMDHNPDTFRPAVIAASCEEPAMTVEQATSLVEALGVDQYEELWRVCFEVNRGGGLPKVFIDGLIHRTNGGSVTTAVNGASHAASSSDE